jgi:hypothetical protein
MLYRQSALALNLEGLATNIGGGGGSGVGVGVTCSNGGDVRGSVVGVGVIAPVVGVGTTGLAIDMPGSGVGVTGPGVGIGLSTRGVFGLQADKIPIIATMNSILANRWPRL